jgi:xanthine dehydrogenase accessory factor
VIPRELTRRAEELSRSGEPFVTATVVRVERPASVQPGSVALVRTDGTIDGFVGGVCAQHSVRLYSLEAIANGEPVLLRIMPDGAGAGAAGVEVSAAAQELRRDPGVVTVKNPCLSGGSIEVFLEPFLPRPRVIVAGTSPIAQALVRLGDELGLQMLPAREEQSGQLAQPSEGDLALIVAAHGSEELSVLAEGLRAGVSYVGLVASPKRGAAVLAELRESGVEPELVERIDTPAGLDIGARSAAEIAVAIMARVIEERRRGGASATVQADAPGRASSAACPICGMTVVVGAGTVSLEWQGEELHFCCEGCASAFQSREAAGA